MCVKGISTRIFAISGKIELADGNAKEEPDIVAPG
jgi:hypothetical protein